MTRTIKSAALYLYAGVICSLPVLPAQRTDPITVVQGRRNIGSEPAPTKIRGVITTFSGWKNSFFLQDSTGGISIDRLENTDVHPGEKVELTGYFRPGRFAPIFISNRIVVIREAGLPKPRVSTWTDLSGGRLDSKRVQVGGIVQAAYLREIWGKQILFLNLHAPDGIITVHILNYPKRDFQYLVDSTVRVTGVCGTIFNNLQQLVGLRLFVPDLNDVVVEKPAIGPARIPGTSLRNLMTFDGPSLQHRMKVTGIVTYQAAETEFYLQQDGFAIRVETSQPVTLRPGMRVNALGFIGPPGPLALTHAVVAEQVGLQISPAPTRIAAAGAIRTEDGFTQAPYNGLLVQVEGRVLELLPSIENELWAIRAGHIQFQAELSGHNPARSLAIEPGSWVRLTGICVAETDENQNLKSFRILLRSPQDIRVLNAPRWISSLLLWLAAILFALFANAAIWLIYSSRNELTSVHVGSNSDVLIRYFRHASRLLSAILVIFSGLAVIGWTFGIRALTFYPAYQAPPLNAALAILASGIALWLVLIEGKGATAIAGVVWSWLTIAIGALILPQDVTTAVCLMLTGGAVLSLHCRRLVSLAQMVAVGVGLVALLNLLNPLFGNETHYGMEARLTMVLPIALGALLLSLAVLFAKPDSGVMGPVSASGIGGRLARRLIPVALVAPVLLAWMRLQLAGFFNARFGLALFALSTIVCFGFVIWVTAVILNRSDKSRSRVEGALRARDQELEMVFERAFLGDFTWDAVRDEVTAHAVVWRLFGAPNRQGSAPAEWFRKRYHPDDAAAVEGAIQSATAQQRPIDLEFRVMQPDRSVRWVASRGIAVYDPSGKLVQVNGIVIDISYRKAVEKRLEESAELCRHLADAMPQIVWRAARDGSVDYYNQRWYEYSGSSSHPVWAESIHPSERDSYDNAWAQSLARLSPLQIEIRLLRASDNAYRWHLVRAVPFKYESGQVEHWFGTATDIDDSKQASAELSALNESLERRVSERSRELEESERRYRLLVEGIQDYAIYLLDAKGRVATWNVGAERIKQYHASEVLGKHFSIFYPADVIVSGHPDEELRTADSEGQYREEGWRVRKNGNLFWASVLITPVRDADGIVTGYSKVVRDMTAQRNAEQLLIAEQKRAEEANRAKSSFLAAMSHEIRTPMNAILGMADLLWETELNEIQREYVGRFRRAGTNLLSLINDILDLSKIESGQFELESVPFNLPDLIERTMELMSPRASMKKVALTASVPPGTPSFIGDPGRLQQILNNIIGNAIKFTERGGVTLSVKPHPDGQPVHLFFKVRDTGIGIPADKLTSIFEDFKQAESSTTRRFGGTGLGLGICRRLVNRMGGNLTVESVLGEGSVFSFDVKLSASDRPVEAEAREIIDFIDRRVLVVDDDPVNRLIMNRACSGWGMQVINAATGAEACDLLQQARNSVNPFSLVLLDHVMPGTSRLELLRHILELEPGLPVILTSSDDQPGDLTKSFALGAAGYIAKPVRRAELLSALSAALRGKAEKNAPLSVDLTGSADKKETEGGSMKLLIAEDSEDNRFLIGAYLRNRTYELTFVRDGREAVETFASRYFDLVLMDIQMPVMDGLAATSAIRDLERERSATPTPILALTANALVEDTERSQAAGCNGHLSKPISKEKLIAAIESLRVEAPVPVVLPEARNGKRSPYEITIPDGFEALSRNYIASRRKEVSRMLEFPSGQGLTELRVFGHNMKGTAVSFGFPELTRLGAAIEEAAKTSDASQLADHLRKVNEYVEYAATTLA